MHRKINKLRKVNLVKNKFKKLKKKFYYVKEKFS